MGDDGGYTLGSAQQCTTSDHITPQGVVTEVDIESVAAAAPWLDGLNNYIQDHLIPDVGKMMVSSDDIPIWFGGLSSAQDVAGKHTSYVRAALTSYRNIAHSLSVASQATTDIVNNYKDVEHNNTVTAQNIDTAFASESGSGGSSTTSTATTSTTTGSDTSSQGSYA